LNKPLFLIDECLSPLLINKFINLGYEAKSVGDVGLRGKDDIQIISWAKEKKAIIVTQDLDFGELWYWYYSGEIGIIILRLSSQKLSEQERIIEYLHGQKVLKDFDITHSLIISTKSRHRIRKLKR
jgi:predicted nuclease of predicted toxin-antitoxin system